MEEITVKKKPGSFLLIVIILELFVAAVLSMILILGARSSSNPEVVMKRFCESVAKKDWASVYDTLNLPDNPSLTKQLFVNARRNDTKQGIRSVIWEETSEWKPKIQSYEPYYGQEAELKAYEATFYRTEEDDPIVLKIVLVKSRKKYFLFDEWKVSPSRYIVSGTGFTIPKGANITLNGTPVMADEWSEGNWQSFGIEFLFSGDYQIEVEMEGMKTYRENVRLKENDKVFTIQLLPDDDSQLELLEQAEKDISQILNAAFVNESFGVISDLFSMDSLNSGEVQNQYNDLRKKSGTDGKGIYWLSIDNIEGTFTEVEDPYEADQGNHMIVTIEGDACEQYSVLDTSGMKYTGEEKSFKIHIQAEYARTNGQWKLVAIPITADML